MAYTNFLLLRAIKSWLEYLVKIGLIRVKQWAKGQDMNSQDSLQSTQYNPDNLLSSLISKLNLKNDAALSRALEVAPPVISKIRHRRLPVGASLLIRMHEVTNMSIQELRELMGDRRGKYRVGDKQFKPKSMPANSLMHH